MDISIWGSSANSVFVAAGGYVYYYNGSEWFEMETAGDYGVGSDGLWGFSRDNVFAVGGYGIWHCTKDL